jgi:pyridoxine kinase
MWYLLIFERSDRMIKMKNVLAIHDLSCYGAASLGIVIPILTAFGYKVFALPSVILSSSTDIDDNPVALETTEWMHKVAERWREQHVVFDAVFTGWLSDPKQIDLIADLCKMRHDKTVIFIDPVLGDSGVLYPSQEELVKTMGRLVEKAQVITPNPTEAALLLGRQPTECGVKEDGTVTSNQAKKLLEGLVKRYAGTLPIIKSIAETDKIGVGIRFTPDNSSVSSPFNEFLLERRTDSPPVGGSGDLFTSLLVGRWLRSDIAAGDFRSIIPVVGSVVKTISDIMQTVHDRQTKELPFRELLNIE